MEKWYEFHWLDGTVFYAKGTSESDAMNKSGYGAGSLKALDYVTEAKELPLKLKETHYIYLDKKEEVLNNSTLFVEKAICQIEEGKTDLEIKIGRHAWKCKAEIKPFDILLTEYR